MRTGARRQCPKDLPLLLQQTISYSGAAAEYRLKLMHMVFRKILLLTLSFVLCLPYFASHVTAGTFGTDGRGISTYPCSSASLDRQLDPVNALAVSRRELKRDTFPDRSVSRINCPKSFTCRRKSKEHLLSGTVRCGAAYLWLSLRYPLPPPAAR